MRTSSKGTNNHQHHSKTSNRLIGDRRSQDLGLAENTSSHKFGTVASRISSISKTPISNVKTIDKAKASAMINSYSKTSSGLRTASFRQNFGTNNEGQNGAQMRDKD